MNQIKMNSKSKPNNCVDFIHGSSYIQGKTNTQIKLFKIFEVILIAI